MFRFAHPQFLHLLWLIPALIIFYVWAFKRKKRAMHRFGSLELLQKLTTSTSRTRQIVKISLIISGFVFMVLTLARPQLGTKLEEVKREGVDIIIALDVSLSMKAEDIKPNRLQKAKHEIENFINKLQGDRIGLIAFAGASFVQCPLTLDYSAAKMFLRVMDPAMIPKSGTAIGEAIATAIKAFEQKERKHKVLILITDGEDHGSEPVKMAKAAHQEGIVIYTVGIGSAQGVPIPVYDTYGNKDFKKDRRGEVVLTKLDEITLEKIALETGGKYYRASAGEVELDKIYNEISKMEKKELAARRFAHYEDRFQYVIVFALVLLIMEALIPERKKERGEWRGRFV